MRRVITGHDAEGKAVILSDGEPPVIRTVPERPGFSISEVWVTARMPAPIDEAGEPTLRPASVEPPPNGTRCRIVEYPPEGSAGALDAEKARSFYSALGSVEASTGGRNDPHPLMHRTKTVDYGIVLSGEIWMVLDDSETLLKPGDVVVQRGTNHAWSNRSDQPCRMAFILIDGIREG